MHRAIFNVNQLDDGVFNPVCEAISAYYHDAVFGNGTRKAVAKRQLSYACRNLLIGKHFGMGVASGDEEQTGVFSTFKLGGENHSFLHDNLRHPCSLAGYCSATTGFCKSSSNPVWILSFVELE